MKHKLQELLEKRILMLDGAMGTMIQRHKPTEEDYRGERFKDWASDLKGNNDLLCLTQPDMIRSIHLEYLNAGSDLIETNTFNANAMSLADYKMQDLSYEINLAAAKLAQEAVAQYKEEHPDAEKFVVGAVGPMNVTLSLSPDVNDPGYRAVTFDQVAGAYYEQIRGLVDGGVDVILLETIFDTLNSKAAIYALDKYFRDTKQEKLPVMISGTITDASGRTLSGQTLEAFFISVAHADPISVGLNCSLGGHEMRPYIEELSELAPCFVSCYPNAGLPNAMGEYDELPEMTADIINGFAESGWVNIVGGCCGTTPEHIAAMAEVVKNIEPRKVPELASA